MEIILNQLLKNNTQCIEASQIEFSSIIAFDIQVGIISYQFTDFISQLKYATMSHIYEELKLKY